jgi:TIR domain
LNFADVFFSDIDIESGARWYNSIIDALEKSDAGLVILTPENITGRRWMMFEVGAIARSVTQARVCPILFGITKTFADQ